MTLTGSKHNLATQLHGEWAHMGAQEPGQEFLDAYRYQIAVMTYAAGAAHYHRLPAMRMMFRNLLDTLIEKMMRKEVWAYWYLTSQSGKLVDPDIKELRKPWADPIRRENIMVSEGILPVTFTRANEPVLWAFVTYGLVVFDAI